MKYRILADMHTHTVASEHAYSTVRENLLEASSKDMAYIAVTDHFYYKDDRISRLNEIARALDAYSIKTALKTKTISGVEGNLRHFLDPDDAKAINENVKWRLVGYHSWFLNAGEVDIAKVPRIFEDSLTNPDTYIKPTAFAHIERHLSAFKRGDDISVVKNILHEIVIIAVENDIVLEINEHSLNMGEEMAALITDWVRFAKPRGAKFCLGTDAHYCEQVGDFKETKRFIDDMDLQSNYILNCDEDALKYLSNKA